MTENNLNNFLFYFIFSFAFIHSCVLVVYESLQICQDATIG